MSANSGQFEVLDPTLEPAGGKAVLSPRLVTLTDKTLGVIWNGRRPTDLILRGVVDTLKQKYDIKEVVFRGKPYLGNVAPNEILDEVAASCDAAITGVGD